MSKQVFFEVFNKMLFEAPTKTKTKTKTTTGLNLGPDVKDLPAKVKAGPSPVPAKVASKQKTRSKAARITPDAQGMRHAMDLVNNIDQIDTSEEPDIDIETDDIGYEPVETTPENLPAIINKEILAQGKVVPEWHMVKNLPGYISKPIRAMGRQVFKAFTSTPIENINVIANLMGQGPNEKREINAVAGWVNKLGDRNVDAELEFESIMPGYGAGVKIYEYKGYTFMFVKDFAGDYIYSWPSSTTRLG